MSQLQPISPDELLTLQLRLGQTLFLAERYRKEAEVLSKQLSKMADRVVAETLQESGTIPSSKPADKDRISVARASYQRKPNFSLIARELGVTPQFVRRVFLGQSTSSRVREALQRALTGTKQAPQGEGGAE